MRGGLHPLERIHDLAIVLSENWLIDALIIFNIFFIIIALELYSHSRFKFVSQRAPQTQPPMGGTVSIIREPCTATSPAPHHSAPDLPRKAGGTSIVTV